MAVHRKSLDEPEGVEEYGDDGIAQAVQIGNVAVWRSRLKPGWSWVKDAMPKTGVPFCPSDHFEYSVSGRIVYHLVDGSQVEGRAGDFLVIEPGHAGEVVGDEDCVMIDW
ncbi:MAG: cupin [Candidatus Limnocylindrales bacterium]